MGTWINRRITSRFRDVVRIDPLFPVPARHNLHWAARTYESPIPRPGPSWAAGGTLGRFGWFRRALSSPRSRAEGRQARYDDGHGQTGFAVQAARLPVSVERNLRRPERLLGLRPARRRAEAQRQGGLVARHGHRPRRPGRPARRARRLSRWSASIARSSCTRRSGSAPGHYDLFHDFMVDCRESKKRYRHDQVAAAGSRPRASAVFVAVQHRGRRRA